MYNYMLIALAIIILFLYGCGSGGSMSIDEMLENANLKALPTADEYKEDGGVVLYEHTHTQFKLDDNWEVQRNQKYHMAFVYFNDKAEDFLTQSIYLDKNRQLISFSARTIKPDGTIIELTDEDLYKSQLKPDFVEFSDDESVKFTFPGVEPGCVLEYSYELAIYDRFSFNDKWKIQGKYPKKYVKYSVQISEIFFRHKIIWNYKPFNCELPKPEVVKDLLKQNSRKNSNQTFYWEMRDIEPIKYEPSLPPYDDIAMYAILGLQRENWDELSRLYWSQVHDRFEFYTDPSVQKLALEIIGTAKTEYERIQRIYNYTQKNYRYVAISIGESGIMPNHFNSIVEKRYGDCKDMTVLNVNLLNSIGIAAYPALVRTKNLGKLRTEIIDLRFNHMIAMVKTKTDKTYWLDATGSSCPVDEIYSSIEGVTAVVLNPDGTSVFIDLPESKHKDNILKRETDFNLKSNGSIEGHTKMTLTGNFNLAYRSGLKDATENNIKTVMERYINSNTPDIEIFNLKYDDPSDIKNDITFEFDFKHPLEAIKTNSIIVFNPFVYTNDSQLNRFTDTDRNYPISLKTTYEYHDIVNVKYEGDNGVFADPEDDLIEKYDFGNIYCFSTKVSDTEIKLERRVNLTSTLIDSKEYETFREYLKNINKANRVNLALTTK